MRREGGLHAHQPGGGLVVVDGQQLFGDAHLQAQVRFLLASFKQRGKSLAFLPQNVQLLRSQLATLTHEKRAVEEKVLELTAAMCALDEERQQAKATMDFK